MSKKILIFIVVVAIITISITTFSRKKVVNAPDVTPPVLETVNNSTTTSPKVIESTNNIKEFAVTGKNYSFVPSVITVKKGDTVKIVFTDGGGFHDLKIDEFAVATKKLKNNETDTVTFIASKTGSFEYYCSVGNHRSMGMKGTLVVTE